MARRVLVVDDSLTDQQAIKRPLERDGFEVETALSASEAMDRLEADTYDLMLLDVIMPDKNGFQFCRQLRRDDRWSHLPIIMITSKDQAADRFWGMKQGATEYLTKPFDAGHLVDVARKHS